MKLSSSGDAYFLYDKKEVKEEEEKLEYKEIVETNKNIIEDYHVVDLKKDSSQQLVTSFDYNISKKRKSSAPNTPSNKLDYLPSDDDENCIYFFN